MTVSSRIRALRSYRLHSTIGSSLVVLQSRSVSRTGQMILGKAFLTTGVGRIEVVLVATASSELEGKTAFGGSVEVELKEI